MMEGERFRVGGDRTVLLSSSFLLISVVLLVMNQSLAYNVISRNDKIASPKSVGISKIHDQQQQHQPASFRQQQEQQQLQQDHDQSTDTKGGSVRGVKQQQENQQMKNNDYTTKGRYVDELQKNIRDSSNISGKTTLEPPTGESVMPSNETNSNSQVVFVNLDRVVSEKNETTRVVSDNGRLIKEDAQIACGETNRNGQPSLSTASTAQTILNRIVGGTRADPGEFPYQVRLNIRSRRGSSLCGGVIIDQRHILTAAHCMTTCSSYFVSTSSVDPSAVTATIGDLRITVADGEQVIGIEKVTPHQRYSACSYAHNNYDIAILRTTKPITWIFTQDGYGSVNRACLPHPNDEYRVGENATVSGWGVMAEGDSSISNNLNAVDVPIVSLQDCRVAYGQRVNQDHLCAGLKQGGRDSCQGDSGGPLVKKVNGQAVAIGIVSFGYGCAQAGSPGVYTKVSHYVDWIKANLK